MQSRNAAVAFITIVITLIGHGTSFGDSRQSYFSITEGMQREYRQIIINSGVQTTGKVTTKTLKERNLNGINVIPIDYKLESGGWISFIAFNNEGGYFYANQTMMQESPVIIKEPRYFIKYPIAKGTKWIINSSTTRLKQGVPIQMNYEIESLEDTVTVPAGTFNNCMKIRAIGSAKKDIGGSRIADVKKEHVIWYASGIGFIKEMVNESSNNNILGPEGKMFVELESFKN